MLRVDPVVGSVARIAGRLTAWGVDPGVVMGAMGEKARAAAVVEVESGCQVVVVAAGS